MGNSKSKRNEGIELTSLGVTENSVTTPDGASKAALFGGAWPYVFGTLALGVLAGLGCDLAASLDGKKSDSDREQLTIPSLAVSAAIWIAFAVVAFQMAGAEGSSGLCSVIVLAVGAASALSVCSHAIPLGGGVITSNKDCRTGVFVSICALAAVLLLELLRKHGEWGENTFYIGTIVLFALSGAALSFYSWASFCDCSDEDKRVRTVSTFGCVICFVLLMLVVGSPLLLGMKHTHLLRSYLYASSLAVLLFFMVLSSEVDFSIL